MRETRTEMVYEGSKIKRLKVSREGEPEMGPVGWAICPKKFCVFQGMGKGKEYMTQKSFVSFCSRRAERQWELTMKRYFGHFGCL